MWEQIEANRRKTIMLVILMLGLLMMVGYALGEAVGHGLGWFGLVLAWFAWLVQAMVSYYSGDKMFLALSRARRIEQADHAVLFNVVEEMKLASGLDAMPAVYIIDDAAPNAFATGRDSQHASVAVTTGLLETLSRDELQGVIGHELGHINNRDILLMTMAGVMLGTIIMLADMAGRIFYYGGGSRRTSRSRDDDGGGLIVLLALVLVILSPILAQLLYFALSRRREYLADACGALYTRYPQGLASALQKISGSSEKLQSASRVTAPMYIINPLAVTQTGHADLTSTHPSTAERIKILMTMAGKGADYNSYDAAYRSVTGRAVGVIPFSSQQESPHTEVAVPDIADDNRHQRVRETTDMMWRLNHFIFIECPCGTRLKIPPDYVGQTVTCPHCRQEHTVER